MPLDELNSASGIEASTRTAPARSSWHHRMVGCLRGLVLFVRLVVMGEFAIRMIVNLMIGQYGSAAWDAAVIVALCPAWDETANK